MKEEPVPVRRIVLDGVVHGVKKGVHWDEITWCETAPTVADKATWNDNFKTPIGSASWSTDAINCLECLNVGGPDG